MYSSTSLPRPSYENNSLNLLDISLARSTSHLHIAQPAFHDIQMILNISHRSSQAPSSHSRPWASSPIRAPHLFHSPPLHRPLLWSCARSAGRARRVNRLCRGSVCRWCQCQLFCPCFPGVGLWGMRRGEIWDGSEGRRGMGSGPTG